ncbi:MULTISPECIES: SDR family NAD(P)-dependent oxidoreductase [Pontibacillus]|uniref:SDR family oxidoreductase n=1 Tax=Pontibacillus chungwhensis TaxID=265426 RepID=A0ABY8UW85_9BACI|nr:MULTISPECIES: SDR family oxidoreductase [Pontibacillus]MCD5324263.1 SDR family oxidoreductase [Pontibacillus sp. HN14]WIF97683.1 SDR family oxidoreductase [Pontibacillus chungwhensis]
MNILLTGATGFLGKQLTLRLLHEGHHVYAIARNRRKAENLLESVSEDIQARLSIVEGDLMEEKAGISSNDLAMLTDQIDTIYHSAAYLSFDESERDKTFHINVSGTKNMLELAKVINARHFYYISTAYTLGTKRYAEEKLHPVDQEFVNPYEESKCHAEHLVWAYKDTLDVNIFRPSIIIGDSKTGEADTSFALYGVIRGLEILKKRTDRKQELQDKVYKFLCTEETSQNFIPVDYVLDVLTAALATHEPNRIYHITNPNPPTNRLLFDMVKEKLDFPNIEMVPSDYAGELSKEEQKFNEPMKVFRPYWNKKLTFDDTNTKQLLRKNGMDHLDMNIDMIERILYGNRS